MLRRTISLAALVLLAGCGRSSDAPTARLDPALAEPAAAAAGPGRVDTAAAGLWYLPPAPGPAAGADPAGAEPPPAPAEDFFADACAEYLYDQAMHLRCQWITGPDRAQVVPLVGWDEPLTDQMRCHPLRDDPQAYRACLARPS